MDGKSTNLVYQGRKGLQMPLLQLCIYGLQQLVRDGICVLRTTVVRVTRWEIASQQLPQLIPAHKICRVAGNAIQFPVIIIFFVAGPGNQLRGKVVEDGGHQTPGLYVEPHTRVVEGAVISTQN